MFKKMLLPIGLLLVILISALAPTPGIWMKEHYMIEIFTAFMFLTNGWVFKIKSLNIGRSFFLMLFAALFFLVIAGPLLGVVGVYVFGFTSLYGIGFIAMSSAPPTLSSCAVITEVAGGNAAASLFLTVLLNLTSIFSLPIVIPLAIGSTGEVSISGTRLLFKLLLIVLFPFCVGVFLKKRFKRDYSWVSYVPIICVLFTVSAAFSASRDLLFKIFRQLPILVLAAAAIHLTLMLFAWITARCLRFDKGNTTAFSFTVSQKTMPIAIGVLSTLQGHIAEAFAVCLIFHMTQLFVDSMIAAALPLERFRLIGKSQEA
ncbi:MAG: bile acid:sodium symporter [Lentisphaerae bacterium]|nr:bile acid:sodium symporter [Lentisphaerota bacterium]MCP4101194.1 bile acid:sodium symporter [Lentisphaerota bacterium]